MSSDSGPIYSSTAELTVGVPQGSILGPLLFVVFANDLHSVFNNSPVILMSYADDTNLLIKVSNREDMGMVVGVVFSKVCEWMEKNKLVINAEKTACMVFRSFKSNIDINYITLNDKQLETSRDIKLLGFYVDNQLNYSAHIDHLCKKLSSVCFGLRTMSNQCSETILKTLYYANFYSHLKYGIIHWGRASNVNRVFILQKYAVRIIKKIKPLESCRDAFKDLQFLTFTGLYIYELLCFVRKNMSIFQKNCLNGPYETRNKNYLCSDQHSTALYQKGAYFNGCLFYNILPNEIKLAPTFNVFKKKVKQLLININPYEIGEFLNKV